MWLPRLVHTISTCVTGTTACAETGRPSIDSLRLSKGVCSAFMNDQAKPAHSTARPAHTVFRRITKPTSHTPAVVPHMRDRNGLICTRCIFTSAPSRPTPEHFTLGSVSIHDPRQACRSLATKGPAAEDAAAPGAKQANGAAAAASLAYAAEPLSVGPSATRTATWIFPRTAPPRPEGFSQASRDLPWLPARVAG
eukprot:scaffold1085_cov407-Prasinococcus_capsulatus_cf.AAC.71